MKQVDDTQTVKDSGYKKLDVWKLAREIAVEVHLLTLHDLPKFEMYEVGTQIRRSSKSIRSNIVEGYGRRNYKNDFIKFLIYSIASKDETIDHLETLWETKSLQDEAKFNKLHAQLKLLGKKLYNFLQSVEKEHLSKR